MPQEKLEWLIKHISPKTVPYIVDGVNKQFEALDKILDGYRSIATLIIGLCAPSSAAGFIFIIKNPDNYDLLLATILVSFCLWISACCAGGVLLLVPWHTNGQYAWNWWERSNRDLSLKELKNGQKLILMQAFAASQNAIENSENLKRPRVMIKLSVTLALLSPIIGATTYACTRLFP
jgi:hypothetical protein